MVFFSLSFLSAVSGLASGQIPWSQQSSRFPKVSKCEIARVSGHSGSFLRLRDWRATRVSLVEESLVIANKLQQWSLGKVRKGPPTCRRCRCYMFPTCHLTRWFSLKDILESIELSPLRWCWSMRGHGGDSNYARRSFSPSLVGQPEDWVCKPSPSPPGLGEYSFLFHK